MRLFVLVSIFCASVAHSGEPASVIEAREILRAIGAKPAGAKGEYKGRRVRVSGCERVAPSRWAGLLLLNQSVEHEYKFAPGCDVEGRVVFKRDGFPVDLRVRGLKNVDRVKARVKLEALPELENGTVKVNADIREIALLNPKGAEHLAGNADYKMILEMLTGDPKENRGGTFNVSRYAGAKASGSVPFKWESDLPAKR